MLLLVGMQSIHAQKKDEFRTDQPKSLFTDFRIAMRENINESDLRYYGWKTDPGMYAFRCRDRKRIRMTLWYRDDAPDNEVGSTFVNITPDIDKCHKNDLKYNTFHDQDEY